MATITLTEVLPGDPREWSPKDKPNVKNYSYKVKAEDGTVYEISTKGDPPKLGPDEFKVTPPKEGTSFPPKLSRVFQGGGGRGRSPEETKAIQRQHSQEMSLRLLAIWTPRIGAEGISREAENEAIAHLVKHWTDWFEADIGSGVGGGAVVSDSSPPAAHPSADSNRKRATSTRLTKAGIPHRETQQAIVKAFCGEVATVAGLDAIDAALANRDWHVLFDEQGIPRPPEIPDTTDLPPLDVVA